MAKFNNFNLNCEKMLSGILKPMVSAIIVWTLLLPGYLIAQESPDEGIRRELEEGKKPDSKYNIPAEKISLNGLFEKLRHETDTQKAKPIERAIWQRWTQSGSPTVDLLMDWSAIAMKKQDWASALDLLDQVVALAPQYAEGWNRRATLYFLRSQYSRSIYDIEQVLKLETRHFGAMAGLGNILQRLDNDARALIMWKKVLEIYPANKNAQKTVNALEEKLSGQGI